MQDQPGANPVSKWLEQIRIANPSEVTEVDKVEAEDLQKDSVCYQESSILPFTPTRKPQLVHLYGEISPTDTNFSEDSVFDSPKSKAIAIPSSSSHPLLHPRYAETDASSVGDDDDNADDKEEGDNSDDYHKAPASLISYDPPSSVATADQTVLFENPPRPTSPPPSTSHLICIVSCLQCVLKDLPCSRTLPACHRCIRNGHGDVCLLQRRRKPDEMFVEQWVCNRTPVLLHLGEGTDDAGWMRKVVLRERLLEEWREKEERRNWVYPALFGERAKEGRGRPRVHPGEGKGRMAFASLNEGCGVREGRFIGGITDVVGDLA